jgi:tetratricopeptide (TPR) repeat protein
MNRGLAYTAQSQHDKALIDCDQALKLAVKFGEYILSHALADRAAALGATGNYETALRDFQAAINIARPHPFATAWAFWLRGLMYTRRGDSDAAISDYTKAIQVLPQFAEPYKARGDHYKAQGNRELAETDYQRLENLKDDPSGSIPSDELSRLHELTKMTSQTRIKAAFLGIVAIIIVVIALLMTLGVL